MIVIDASAVIELLLATEAGAKVGEIVASDEVTLHAPHLVDLEVAQVLRRWTLAGKLALDRASAALQDLADLDLLSYPHDVLLPRIWELRANISAYDASYLALAEVLGADLVTLDRALRSVPGVRARVVVVS